MEVENAEEALETLVSCCSVEVNGDSLYHIVLNALRDRHSTIVELDKAIAGFKKQVTELKAQVEILRDIIEDQL